MRKRSPHLINPEIARAKIKHLKPVMFLQIAMDRLDKPHEIFEIALAGQ